MRLLALDHDEPKNGKPQGCSTKVRNLAPSDLRDKGLSAANEAAIALSRGGGRNNGNEGEQKACYSGAMQKWLEATIYDFVSIATRSILYVTWCALP